MEQKSYFIKDEATVMALCDRLQDYYGRKSDLVRDIRAQKAMHALRAKLFAFDMEHRALHEACAGDVLPVEDAEDLGGNATDVERYGISHGDDLLDEVDIVGLDETPHPTFISQYLAPELEVSRIRTPGNQVAAIGGGVGKGRRWLARRGLLELRETLPQLEGTRLAWAWLDLAPATTTRIEEARRLMV
ncbi:hypothetical protein Droror1_Dr00020401 [Drosera rotundifolia]